MHTPRISALLLPLVIIYGCANATADELMLTVEPSLAEVGPQPPGTRFVQLPDMAFTMQIATKCDANMQAESVSIGISDTRLTLGPEALADTAATGLSIVIPRQQLAPLTIENFCFNDSPASDTQDLNIVGALTAQASLRCVGENRQSIIHRVAPLAVTLRCKTGDDD